jgi:hypothetical protein
MRPIRVGRALILALVAVSAIHCRDRGDSVATPAAEPPAQPPAAGGPYLLIPSETAAYRRGREREITLLREALAGHRSLSPLSSIMAGAAAAGLPVDGYELLVARVDSGLRLRAAGTADASGPAQAEWAELDSLRVELKVLRTRLDAVEAGTP